MRILMIVQLVDERDWLRGFIVPWIRELAARVEHVDVLTLERREAVLPENVTVHTMGKEHGHGRLKEFAAFHKALWQLAPKVDAIFSHMTPRYAWLAAPYTLFFRKPQVLWFVHRQVNWELRLAHLSASRIVTASPESFGIRSSKVRVLGHGIDLGHFDAAKKSNEICRILSVGRLSPIKNHHVLIQAAGHLRDLGYRDFKVLIAGGETSESPDYPQQLRELVLSLQLEGVVKLLGAVPYQQIALLYQQADLTVNLCPTGGMDKAVLESMASSVPVLVHNQTFLPLIGEHKSMLWTDSLEAEEVAKQLGVLLSMPSEKRAKIGELLADTVRLEYGLGELMDRLVGVFQEVAS